MVQLSPAALAILDEVAHLPLEQRVLELVRRLRKEGIADARARPAAYPLTPTTQSATSCVLDYELEPTFGPFVVVVIGHPNNDNGGVVVTLTKLGTISRNVLDGDTPAEHLCDVDSDSDEARPLPWPIVFEAGGQMHLEASAASGLDTFTHAPVRGFHVDDYTAELLRQRELGVLPVSRSYTAAATMQSEVSHQVTARPLDVSHLLARETLTGDTVRARVRLKLKTGIDLLPGGKVIPPSSPAKAGARLEVPLRKDDTITPELLYTSALGTGTAALKLTFVGSRRYA